jgi:hypothetical protein
VFVLAFRFKRKVAMNATLGNNMLFPAGGGGAGGGGGSFSNCPICNSNAMFCIHSSLYDNRDISGGNVLSELRHRVCAWNVVCYSYLCILEIL